MWAAILNIRDIAVYIFFILSGFWVTKSILASANLKEYVKKRFTRIFPAYWFVIVFFALILVVFSDLSVKDYFANRDFIKYLIVNFSTLNFLQPNLPGVFGGAAVNGSLWTIKIEIAFYIVLPIVLYILNKFTGGRRTAVLTGFYVLSVLVSEGIAFVVSEYGLNQSLINQFPSLLCYFLSGMICLFGLDFIRKHEIVLFFSSVIIVVLHYFLKTIFLFPLALGIIVVTIAFRLSFLNFVGRNKDYSYLIYLWHYPVIMCLIELGVFASNPIIGIIMSFFIVVFTALLWENIEKSFAMRKIKK